MPEDNPCTYARTIGSPVKWQTDSNGLTVCVYCHAKDHNPPADAKPAAKTLRK
jgi:hypothetical protein